MFVHCDIQCKFKLYEPKSFNNSKTQDHLVSFCMMYNNSSVTGSICFLHNKTTWVLLLKASTNNFPLLLILVASLNKKMMMVKQSKLCFSASRLFLTTLPFQKKLHFRYQKNFQKKKKKKKTRGEKRPPVWASAS